MTELNTAVRKLIERDLKFKKHDLESLTNDIKHKADRLAQSIQNQRVLERAIRAYEEVLGQ